MFESSHLLVHATDSCSCQGRAKTKTKAEELLLGVWLEGSLADLTNGLVVLMLAVWLAPANPGFPSRLALLRGGTQIPHSVSLMTCLLRGQFTSVIPKSCEDFFPWRRRLPFLQQTLAGCPPILPGCSQQQVQQQVEGSILDTSFLRFQGY